ncbi:cyclophane-forming radical SAM/SPASM peptide maturase GrrM/OscB [Bradyrhizobium erythrophlei]|jgi:uncharacterized protein|uniref:Radical SAM core domain-containing protein n=1 Tax=Bradyrhizobium erythrophlei TaxID=1437360 RepID=A0A1M5IDN3_9BRAD|nr:cyclophane-forming radical SAM/SPASM peptide maturase GrrM/OscB [Bradyrhizobium erythrophlei]SHG26030.1 uncharacterized protein SAMN05443248_0921 [Bradyrhizobium erythrophlei]
MLVAGPIGLVVLQSTGFCNIDCAYCYLPDRANPRQTMELSTVGEVARLIFDSRLLKHDLDIVWHAGEPLTLSPDYYAQAIGIIERRRSQGVDVHYGIQTNATLIDDNWIDLFERHAISVGVSLDGPRDLHDRNRKYRNGAGSHDRAVAGIAKLQARGYPFHFIGVVTTPSLSRGAELVDYYQRFGPTAIGLNIEELEAHNTRSALYDNCDRTTFERFIGDVLLEAARPGDTPVVLRDFQRTLSSLLAGTPEDNDQVIPLRILNVAHNGDISTFSPELLALEAGQRQRFIFGNVHQCAALPDILSDARFVSAYREISQGVKNCAGACEYFQYCGGGAPVNKLSETGSLQATETTFCAFTKKAWVDVCLRLANAQGNQFEVSLTL